MIRSSVLEGRTISTAGPATCPVFLEGKEVFKVFHRFFKENTEKMKVKYTIFLWIFIFPLVAVAEDKYAQLVYEDNIGFMQNVPEKLRRELPMCEEFLDVKWIREMPDGYWVGRVIVDVRTDNKTEQRELAVVEDKRRSGHILIFDITKSSYQGHLFDELIMSADIVRNYYFTSGDDVGSAGFTVVVNKKQTVLCDGVIGSQLYLERGVISSNLIRANKKICITLPDRSKWLFKQK